MGATCRYCVHLPNFFLSYHSASAVKVGSSLSTHGSHLQVLCPSLSSPSANASFGHSSLGTQSATPGQATSPGPQSRESSAPKLRTGNSTIVITARKSILCIVALEYS